MSEAYELFMSETTKPKSGGPGRVVRWTFGLAPCLDDVPNEVTDTNGFVWVQVYLDNIDRYAIFIRSANGNAE